MIEFDEDKQKLHLAELRRKEEEEFIRIAADKRGFSYVNLASSPINLDALRIMPEEKARATGITTFNLFDKKLAVAITNPDNPETISALKELENKGYKLTVFMVSKGSMEKILDRYKEISMTKVSEGGSFQLKEEDVREFSQKIKNIGDAKNLIEAVLVDKKNIQTTHLAEIILAGALSIEASDIHIEPERDDVRLRYRLDGVLNEVARLDIKTFNYLLSRMKLISGMRLNVHNEAQDGRFSIRTGDTEIEVRSSIIPGSYGESVVLRVLNPKSIQVPMEELGIEPYMQKVLEKEISKPNGMLLNTGPTGSGKTTTLYAFLRKVHTPETKIITVEDPVEYHLPGIVQTQTSIDEGYTFLSGLRAILRQDPDVIMIGEIRDSETATIAVNAALTGHLVFSTLHTNNAAGTFPRLFDLGINPKIVTSAINAVMAQRLVRKLCEHCKKEIKLEGVEKTLTQSILKGVTIDEYKNLPTEKIWTADDKGCDKCNHTGYKGRTGLYETILADEEIGRVVLENPSEKEISAVAKKQGLLDMKEDGVVKILKGVTSFDELRRVIDLDE